MMICGDLESIVKNLEYRGYKSEIYYSDSDKVYYGRLVGIKDIVGFHALNIHDIEKEFRNAVDDYVKFKKECGRDD